MLLLSYSFFVSFSFIFFLLGMVDLWKRIINLTPLPLPLEYRAELAECIRFVTPAAPTEAFKAAASALQLQIQKPVNTGLGGEICIHHNSDNH